METREPVAELEQTDIEVCNTPAHIGRLRTHIFNILKLGNFLNLKYFCMGVHVRFQCFRMKPVRFIIAFNYQADLINKRTVISFNNGRCFNHSYVQCKGRVCTLHYPMYL